MNTFKAADLVDGGFELLLQLGFVCVLLAVAVWIWPDGLLDTPLTAITLKSVLFAVGALVLGGLALLGSYFIAVEPIYKALKKR